MKTKVVMFATILNLNLATALAAVSVEDAKQLGGPVLTEWGAERAGNKEGTIPAWIDERVKLPASYNPKEPEQVPDPWEEKPLYSITAQNMEKYADKLTDGQKEMLKKYPKYRMDVYPTHRTVQYPKWILENTLKNATSARTINGGISLEGTYAGVPFPIPKTGNEVVWNHQLAYRPLAFRSLVQTWMVDTSGRPILQGLYDVHFQYPFWDQNVQGIRSPTSAFYIVRFDALAPARKVGENDIIINSIDPVKLGQRVYMYIPGQRRVKLAPDLAYDTPSPVTGGVATMDESSVFLGAQDRFNFKLIGKKERYLQVNEQKLTGYKTCPPETALMPHFPNPDCFRFELRRTWQVEATVKPEFRSVMPRRMMYFDEDWSGAAVGDMYDASGKLYHVDYLGTYVMYQYPEQQYQVSQLPWTFDLLTGAYVTQTWLAFKTPGYAAGGFESTKPYPDTMFSPEALAGSGVR